jgi:hypothetical protein
MSHYNFRLSGRNFFLTYPKTSISKEIVLEQLNSKFPNQIKGYFIVKEMHKSELEEAPTPHIHAIVCFNKKKNIRTSTFFDLTFLNEKVHGSYETIRSFPEVLRYLEKEDMIPLKDLSSVKIVNTKENDTMKKENKKEKDDKFFLELKKLAEEKGLYAALDFYEVERPVEYVKKYKSIESNLRGVCNRKIKLVYAEYNVEDFDYPEKFLEWYNFHSKDKTLILVGASGLGKTSAIKSFLTSKDHKPLYVNNVHALKNLKENHTVIVFDDFDWSKLNVSEKISLFEKESNRDIKILYESINISSKLIKIVLTNSLSSVFCTETDSLSRRTFIIELEKPLIK